MTRQELLDKFDNIVYDMRKTLLERNIKYATENDALHNIRFIGLNGVIGHLKDKAIRLETSLSDPVVTSDTCRDSANYAILYQILYETLIK